MKKKETKLQELERRIKELEMRLESSSESPSQTVYVGPYAFDYQPSTERIAGKKCSKCGVMHVGIHCC